MIRRISLPRRGSTVIDDVFREMGRDLQDHYKSRPPGTFVSTHLRATAEYLLAVQNENGSWGNPAVFDTGITLLAIGVWRERAPHTLTGVDVDTACTRAFDWLAAHQHGGTWGNNIWDAAMIVRCAALFARLDNPLLNETLTWLKGQERDQWGLSAGLGPHYAAQALLAFCAVQDIEYRDKLTELLQQTLRDQLASPPVDLYQTAQVVEGLLRAGLTPYDNALRKATERLTTGFIEASVNFSNFIEICAIMVALSTYNDSLSEEGVPLERVQNEMLNPARRQSNGSWYDNTVTTSFALIALSQAREPVILEATSSQMAVIVDRAKARLHAEFSAFSMTRRRVAARFCAIGFLSCILILSTILSLGLVLDLSGQHEAAWGVTGLIAAMLGLALTGISEKAQKP